VIEWRPCHLLLTTFSDGVGTITFENPKKRNCLSADAVAEMLAALDEFEKQNAIAVVLRAQAGLKVWSAGHDVNELPKPGRDPLPYAGPLTPSCAGSRNFPGP